MRNELVKWKRAAVLTLLAAGILFSAMSPGGAAPAGEAAPPDAGEPASENGRYALQYVEDPSSILITSRETGETLWNSAVTQELYDLEMTSESWKNYMQSMLAITYIMRGDDHGNYLKAYSAADSTQVTAEAVQNGVRLRYAFTEADITVSLNLTLDAEGLKAEIPYQSIREGEDCILYSAELFPFLGAAAPQEDGYLVYPEGSGALSYFRKTGDKQPFAQPLALDIYGPLIQEELLGEDAAAGAMLPAYGIQKGGRAFVAAITEGDASARILVNPSLGTSSVALNRQSFEFVYRNRYRIYLSNLVVNGKNSSQNLYGQKLDSEMLPIDREVRLLFLEGNEAGYSGMANAYRAFLLRTGRLKKSPLQDSMMLAIDLFMGARDHESMLGSLIAATTFSDAASIAEDYLGSGMQGIRLTLRGWNKNGYGWGPQPFTPDAGLGGKKGLAALDALAKKYQELNIFLETDLIHAVKGSGFSKGRDAAVNPINIPVTDETQTRFLLSPYTAQSRNEKSLKRQAAYPNLGRALTGLGRGIYQDYNTKHPAQRAQAMQLWRDIAESGKMRQSVQGGNLYLLSSADSLWGINTETPMSQITDERIPWFQMIVYNSIPYTAETGNSAYDLDQRVLKWIEYGCVPYFELTRKSPSVLRDTEYTELFTSEHAKWKDRVAAIGKEWAGQLGILRGKYMVRHETAADGLVVVTYDDGTRAVLNYAEENRVFEGKTVGAEHYILLEGSGDE